MCFVYPLCCSIIKASQKGEEREKNELHNPIICIFQWMGIFFFSGCIHGWFFSWFSSILWHLNSNMTTVHCSPFSVILHNKLQVTRLPANVAHTHTHKPSRSMVVHSIIHFKQKNWFRIGEYIILFIERCDTNAFHFHQVFFVYHNKSLYGIRF